MPASLAHPLGARSPVGMVWPAIARGCGRGDVAQLEFAPAALPDELRRFYASYGYQSDLTFGPLMLRNQRELGALPAAIEGDVALSWRELVDAAARFGGFLSANGVEPGDVVT